MHRTLARQLFACLRRMDAEATPLSNGDPTGLHGYRAFVNGCYKDGHGTPWENAWSDRIRQLLCVREQDVLREHPYPRGSKQRCDLILLPLAGGGVWIEVKGAWRVDVGDDNRPAGRNRNYRKHLACAAADVNKLRLLKPSESSQLGMLLVGFDTAECRIDEDDLSGIRHVARGWDESYVEWPDGAYSAFRIRCWFWSGRCVRAIRSADVARSGGSRRRW
jgi:hypothetical protein